MIPKSADVVIIGGGPAGSTAGTLLAQAGLQTVIVEREIFPRFHIGESLLPANLPIFKRLGVFETLEKTFIRKPGGKWVYNDLPILGNFSLSEPNSCFHETPYAYTVERATFDKILVDNAISSGAKVLFNYAAVDLLRQGSKVIGLQLKDSSGALGTLKTRFVIDASGQRAFIATHLGIRAENSLRRMAVFAHYQAQPQDKELQEGWFTGQLIDNGWVWYIPLGENKVSVGAVVSLDHFKKVSTDPKAFLENLMDSTPYLRNAIGHPRRQTGNTYVLGNLGYTTQRLAGEGWVLCGDAGFFIDPCYSSGVYLAMSTGETVADILMEGFSQNDLSPNRFKAYEARFKKHEKMVLRMVEIFYIATRNRTLRWIIPRLPRGILLKKFNTFIGGDFARNTGLITLSYWNAKLVSKLFP